MWVDISEITITGNLKSNQLQLKFEVNKEITTKEAEEIANELMKEKTTMVKMRLEDNEMDFMLYNVIKKEIAKILKLKVYCGGKRVF